MSKLIIMSGLPGSGKSTKAEEILKKHGNTVRINKDLLRTMLHFDKFNGTNESMTQEASSLLAAHFIGQNKNVIIDDTNLNPKVMQYWKDFAKMWNIKIEHCDIDTDFEECVYRDDIREKRVGYHVILKMALQYKDFMKGEKVIICDIDGTIVDITHRLEYAKGEKKDWNKFFSLIKYDKPRFDVIQQVTRKAQENNAVIIFVSARPEKYRVATEVFIDTYFNQKRYLIMRPDNDKRPDTEVKSEIYEKYLKKLDIVEVFDDRPSVIRMWREKGLSVNDVGQGIEF